MTDFLGRFFGRRRPEVPVQLVPFAKRDPRSFGPLVCDGYVVLGITALAPLVAALRELQAANADKRVLVTLDNVGQACYTMGHCVMARDLDSVEGHDLSALPPEAFEDGEHCGYFTTPQEFPFRLANLLRFARDVRLDDAHGFLLWQSDDHPNDPAAINQRPDEFLLLDRERDLFVQLVPVTRAADALAAFPNGYFTSDLGPAQNHALALRLEQAHGLALFGVGAATLGFWRDTPLSDGEAMAAAQDIAALYEGRPADAAERLAQAITGKDHVFVRYSES